MILNIMILKRLIRLNQYHVPFFWNHVKQNDTKTKSKRNDDSDGGADPKIKDLGRERRKQKRTQITNEELLQRLKEAEANIRVVQKDDYTYEP